MMTPQTPYSPYPSVSPAHYHQHQSSMIGNSHTSNNNTYSGNSHYSNNAIDTNANPNQLQPYEQGAGNTHTSNTTTNILSPQQAYQYWQLHQQIVMQQQQHPSSSPLTNTTTNNFDNKEEVSKIKN